MRSHQRGVSLLELMLVIGVVATLAGIAVLSVNNARLNSRHRGTVNQVISYIEEARSLGLRLGAASGTTRVQLDATCPTAGGAIAPWWTGTGARAGLLIDTANARLIYTSHVTRNAAANPPVFTLFCKQVNLDVVSHGDTVVDLGAPNTQLSFYTVFGTMPGFAFDGRGFMQDIPGGGFAQFAFQATATPDAPRQYVMVLASGYACQAGGNGTCARDLE